MTSQHVSSYPLRYLGGRSVYILRQDILRNLHQSVKSGDITDDQFDQHPTTNFRLHQVQTLDETIVGHAFGAAGHIDTNNP